MARHGILRSAGKKSASVEPSSSAFPIPVLRARPHGSVSTAGEAGESPDPPNGPAPNPVREVPRTVRPAGNGCGENGRHLSPDAICRRKPLSPKQNSMWMVGARKGRVVPVPEFFPATVLFSVDVSNVTTSDCMLLIQWPPDIAAA